MALTPYACWKIALGRHRSDLDQIPRPDSGRPGARRAGPAVASRLSLRQALGIRLVTVGLTLALGSPARTDPKAAIPHG